MRQPIISLSKAGTIGVLVAFLGLNALSSAVLAWGLASIYVLWRLLVRPVPTGIPYPLIRLIALPFCLMCLGSVGFYQNPEMSFWKDCWYFCTPIVYIAFGYYLAESFDDPRLLVQSYCLTSTVISIVFLVQLYGVRGGLLASTSVEEYRHQFGTGVCQSMIPIVLLCLANRSGIDLGFLSKSRATRIAIYVIALLAVMFSLSRTLIMLCVAGFFVGVRPSRQLLGSLAIVMVVVAGIMLLPAIDSGHPAVADAFFSKVLNSSAEVGIHSYGTLAEINDNWRGFESYRALSVYEGFNAANKIFGGGLGTLVDIGFAMDLGGPESMQDLPVLHNGYLYLLIKVGIVGIMLFVLFLFLLFSDGVRFVRAGTGDERFYGYIYIWSALAFALTQGVITGIYNKSDLATNLSLLGCVSAVATMYQQSTNRYYQSPRERPDGTPALLALGGAGSIPDAGLR